MNKNTLIIISIILIIVAAAGGFFAGMQYQKSQRQIFANGQFQGRFGSGGQGDVRGFGRGPNFNAVRGQVLNINSGSLTVKMQNGSTKIVVVSGSTSFEKSQTAAQSDLKTGDTIMVIGTSNSDGSVTAQNVSINPIQMFRGNVSPTKTQ